MKNGLIALIILAIVGAVAFSMTQSGETDSSDNTVAATSNAKNTANSKGTGSSATGSAPSGTSTSGQKPDSDEKEGYEDLDERPAAEIYKSAEDALAAVRKGAQDYDDIVLEQFTQPGEDCTWCDSFYTTITDLMRSGDSSEDEKAYYSELLAISGRVDHVKTLVESIRELKDSDDADVIAESLELTIGGDDVVEYLKGHLNDKNELLQESVVAAITNQGSKFAAETLYSHTVASGDADGYYSLGIGLGEMIPDPEALPYLQELMMKRDDYSHLAVKALLNQGYDGLVIVFDTLTNSKDPEKDRLLLADGIDHVYFEDEIETYMKKVVEENKQPILVEFAKEVLEDFALEAEEDEDDEEEE